MPSPVPNYAKCNGKGCNKRFQEGELMVSIAGYQQGDNLEAGFQRVVFYYCHQLQCLLNPRDRIRPCTVHTFEPTSPVIVLPTLIPTVTGEELNQMKEQDGLNIVLL